MLGNDIWIRKQCIHPARNQIEGFGREGDNLHTCPNGGISILPMITPFEPNQVRVGDDGNKVLSFGTSSFGYDIRAEPKWKYLDTAKSITLDPKQCNEEAFTEYCGDSYVIPPNSFVLAVTIERFNIPRNVLATCLGKSTYARLGIVVNVTPLEPEWEGHLVLELSNTTELPVRVYANEGIAQLMFHISEDCGTSYADRGGKYQHQEGIVLPKL